MKLKKILTSVIASAAIIGNLAITGYAVGDGEASYCFDNQNKIADWQTYGSVEETGFKVSQINSQSLNGDGCMLISEDVNAAVEGGFGGVYFEAASAGLESFDGCTVTASVLLCEGAENAVENFSLFSDGIVWMQSAPEGLNSRTWTEVTLTLPTDADNSKVGFTIPTLNIYTGDIMYIDDVVITRPDGTTVANLGDYQQKTITSTDAVPTGVNIALIILLVVLILAIIGGVGLILSNVLKKFT